MDRHAWAVAILAESHWWGYKGIQNPSPQKLRDRGSRIRATIMADGNFMDDLILKHTEYMASDDGDEEGWEEHVRNTLHGEGCCPHGSAEERAVFEMSYKQMLADPHKRFEWASERVDSHDVDMLVDALCEDVESVEWFLKEHPVTEVWRGSIGDWVDIDDVVGYCLDCAETMTEDERLPAPKNPPHVFDDDCTDCIGIDGINCQFNENAEPRKLYKCVGCDHVTATDIDVFVELHLHPFNWPPGAPFPPRWGFAGQPLNVPPDEKD